MLEEPYPDRWRMLFWTHLSDRVVQGAHGFLKDLLHQVIFILIIAIERGPAHHRALGQLADGERVETPLLDQLNERLPQQFLRASHAYIAHWLSHFAFLVSSDTHFAT